MINLMYLVLTAMLALNVSAKIINAFFVVDRGIKTAIPSSILPTNSPSPRWKEAWNRIKNATSR